MTLNKKSLYGVLLIILSYVYGSYAVIPAGTVIGNAATATYYDEDNNQYTTTSNIVQTTVQAVCGVDVLPDNVVEVEGIPGQTVYLPFQVKNTGNFKGTYSLTTLNLSYQGQIYLDKNQNGVIDPGEQAVTSITLGIDEVVSLIVSVKIPNNATVGDEDEFSLKVTSDNDSNCNDSSTGRVKVVNDAVIKLTKSVDKSQGLPGDELTYTINFKNIGTRSAKAKDGFIVDLSNDGTTETDVEGILVKDEIPKGSSFVSGSASGNPTNNPDGFVVYSNDGSSWYKDEGKVPGEIKYIGFFMPDSSPQDNNLGDVLSADQQGTLTFKVRINNPFDDNDSSVDNKAVVLYTTNAPTDNDRTVYSNETHTTVPESSQADISLGSSGNPEEDAGNNWEDDNLLENVPAGSWVEFVHTVKNNSNIDDIPNLKVDTANTQLPASAIVEFWNSDKSAKLIDTDGDGNVDLGTVSAGTSKEFVVRVFIPPNTQTKAKDGNIDYYLTVVAVSHNNSSETDKSKDNIDGVIGAQVDLGRFDSTGDDNDDPSDGNTSPDVGNGDSDDILSADNGVGIIRNIVSPGEKAVFHVEILNKSPSSDSYSLNATGYVGNIHFYMDYNCDGTKEDESVDTPLIAGTILSENVSNSDTIKVDNVANIQAGDTLFIGNEKAIVVSVNSSTKEVKLDRDVSNHVKGERVSEKICMIVETDIPDNEPPGEHNIVFTASSQNSGATDSIDAYLKVNPVEKFVITPDGSDQLPPGGTTTYQHTITNRGNTTKDVLVTIPSNTTLDYTILDNDGGIQGQSYLIQNLRPGESRTIYVKVSAKSTVNPGTVETIDVSLKDPDNDSTVYDTAQDTTTVIEGYMQLTKYVDKTQVKPGETLTYTIKYKNIGNKNAINVVITDNIPNFTEYIPNSLCYDKNCDGECSTGEQLTDDKDTDTGEYDPTGNLVRFRVGTGADGTKGGTVQPGEEGCVIFKVKVKE